MSTGMTLICDRLSGHNPDIVGHDYNARRRPHTYRLQSHTHIPVYQWFATIPLDYRTNPDMIRTYLDMDTNGSAVGLSQRQVCSPYPGSKIDISGVAISNRPEPQPVTSSAVHTAVLHITSATEHIGAPAFRVSDRSGTPQAGNPAEEYSGERDPRRIWPRGTPKEPKAMKAKPILEPPGVDLVIEGGEFSESDLRLLRAVIRKSKEKMAAEKRIAKSKSPARPKTTRKHP
jgi:hypothetical protein